MDYNEIRKRERRKKRNDNKLKIIIAVLLVIAIMLMITTIFVHFKYTNNTRPNNISTEEPSPSPTQTAAEITPSPSPTATPTPEPVSRRGTAQSIPSDVREFMTGRSYKSNNNISLDELSYLTIPHYDFNYNITEGHMVVNKALAEEVLDIFAELFDIKYPIERMSLVDNYGADDFESIEANNTSAFNYRMSTSGGGLSRHALGRAIDINPQINPYVNSNGTGAHSNAAEYWSRDKSSWSSEVARAAYIGRDSQIYKIFVDKYGWTWGGSWSSYRDYQHFEKAG